MIDQYNRYHFENNFFGNPKTCGALSVYQLGDALLSDNGRFSALSAVL